MDISILSTVFGVVAGMSIFGNTLLCGMIIRRKTLLKKTYNILILNLAVTDIFGGIFLLATPNYVFQTKSYPKMWGIGGELFCRMVFSTYFLYVCGKASNLSVMCLAIERWYAVVKPTKYKFTFGRRRLYTYLALIWISAAVTGMFGLFITELVDGSCQWSTRPYGAKAESVFAMLKVTVTFYIPTVVTWASFAHIWLRMTTNNAVGSQNNIISPNKSVIRMCAIAAFFLTVLWFPTDTFWLLKKFKILILPRIYYRAFHLMAFCSSFVNPFVYCLSNKTYRDELLSLFDRLRFWDWFTRVGQASCASNEVELRNIP